MTRQPYIRGLSTLLVTVIVLVGVHAAAPGRVQFTQPAYNTTEDFGVAYISVQRHLGSDGRAAVYVSTAIGSGSAVVGRDFQPIFNYSLVWHDGDDLDKELYVKVLNDGLPQDTPKTFTLFLHDAVGATLNADRAQTTITLVPPTNLFPGVFSFLNASATVFESSDKVTRIPVLWQNGTTSTARVRFEVLCGTACSPSDFAVQNPKDVDVVTWTRGSSSSSELTQYISLSIFDDGVYEQAETFTLRLQLPEQTAEDVVGVGSIGSIKEMQLTIAGPNNVVAGVLQFEADCFPACPSLKYNIESGGIARVIVQRRGGSDGKASVTVRTIDDSAFAGVDYLPINIVLTWQEGEQSDKEVVVTSIAGAVRNTATRFFLKLSDNLGGSLAGDHASITYVSLAASEDIFRGFVDFIASAELETVLIDPDESFVPLLTRTTSRLELCPRLIVKRPGLINISLRRHSGILTEVASVTVQLVDGTAQTGVDVDSLPGDGTATIKWAAGDTTDKSIQLNILESDEMYVESRSFWVEIVSANNVGLGDCNNLEVVLNGVAAVPSAVGFDLDMNAGTIFLSFSAPVIAGSFDPTKLHLQSIRGATASVFTFSALTTTSSPDGTTIQIDFSQSDFNALRMLPGLAKTAGSTFLSMEPGVFSYIIEGCTVGVGDDSCPPPTNLPPIQSTDAIQVRTYQADTTHPVLLGFSLDLPRRLVKLRFSKPVDAVSVNVAGLAFSDTASGANRYTLTTASSRLFTPNPDPLSGALLFDTNRLAPDGTYVTLLIGDTDATSISVVGNGQVGISASSTYIAAAANFIHDYADPPNSLVAVGQAIPAAFLRVSAADCTPCPAGTYLVSSCSDLLDRVCAACSVCPTNSYASTACTATSDTICYPCTECRGGQFASVQCTPTTDRVCTTCTKCTSDEYEAFPCYNGVDRVCRTCNSCTLTKSQEQQCWGSLKWKRIQMRSPYSCPTSDQQYKTLEARLQDEKSNKCGAGRCSCVGSGIGNANANGDSFPDDRRCTGPEAYNILL